MHSRQCHDKTQDRSSMFCVIGQRSGVTSALIEIAPTAKIGVLPDEASIPVSEKVKGAVHPCLTNADSALSSRSISSLATMARNLLSLET